MKIRTNNEEAVIENNSRDKFKTMMFLSEAEGRKGEGGLRMQGCFKKSLPDKPLITVITVVFNDEKYLEETIQSVINQTYANVEYIIIDGASTDGTVDIIKKYEGRIDYWVSEPDGGIYDAMNKGIGIANGEWIYFLGSDDVLLNVLHEMAGNFIDKKTIYYGDVYMPKKHRRYDGEFTLYKLMLRNICHQAIFYPKEVFNKYLFDLKYKSFADYYLNILCFTDKAYHFKYISKLVAIFNDFNGFSAKNRDVIFQKNNIKLIKTNFSYPLYLCFIIRTFVVTILDLIGCKEIIKKIRRKIVA